MAYLIKINKGGQTFLVKDSELTAKVNSLLIEELQKTPAVPDVLYTAEEAEAYNTEHGLTSGDEGFVSEGDVKTPGTPAVNYWVPDTEDKAKFEALTDLDVVNLKSVLTLAELTPAVLYESDDPEVISGEKEVGDVKTPAVYQTPEQALEAITRKKKGDVYLLKVNENGEDQYKEYIYTSNGWEVLGVIKADVDISGKADTVAVKAVIDAFTIDEIMETKTYTAEDEAEDPTHVAGTTYEVGTGDFTLTIPTVEIAATDDPVSGINAGQIKVVNA